MYSATWGTAVAQWLRCCAINRKVAGSILVPREMEVIPGGQPDAAGRKLSSDTLNSARALGENPRKEQTVVRMGHGVRRGTPHTAG